MYLFTLNSTLTEHDFLTLEYGFTLEYLSTVRLLEFRPAFPLPLNIATTNTLRLVHLAKTFPKDTINVFLLGNETFDKQQYITLQDIPAIRAVFTQFPIRTYPSFRPFLSALGLVRDGYCSDLKRSEHLLRDIRSNLIRLQNARNLRLRYPLLALPLGYSKSFSRQLLDFLPQLEKNSSLIDQSPEQGFFPILDKMLQFGFVGQLGDEYRQFVIKLAKEMTNSSFHISQSFGGNVERPENIYLQMLSNSTFNLIPHGNSNVRNHRYLESLLSGSLPVLIPYSVLDTSVDDIWTRQLPQKMRYSWRLLLREISSWDISQVYKWFQLARNEVLYDIAQSKKQVIEYCT